MAEMTMNVFLNMKDGSEWVSAARKCVLQRFKRTT
jgi:hypothetical protein